nr:receptor-like protein 47 [Ziziphus jujuba var. spinosa]
MELSLCLIMRQKLVLRLLLINVFIANHIYFVSVQKPSCHDEERSALLQFKDSFVINQSASSFEGAYPKFLQWKSNNCCLWDGINCDAKAGHVIALHLSSSCLFGSINSNSTLFSLIHLQILSLSDNHFNFSQIPTAIGQLSHLTYLNLSSSAFYGQVPLEISDLNKLSSLEMSYNYDPVIEEKFLQLKDPNFKTLVRNLTGLEILILNFVDMSSESLTRLQLGDNNLSLVFGEASRNATDSKFKLLDLSSCNLRKFPHFLKHQNELEWLVLSRNNIDGQILNWMLNISINTLPMLSIPSNLLAGFNQLPVVLPWVNLRQFDISFNMLQGPLPIPPPSIVDYDASSNMLAGEISPLVCIIPPCLGNSASLLVMLSLRNNSLHGIIPEICSNNMSKLKMIDVSHNRLQGELPRSLSKCLMLEAIVVSNNQFHDSFPSWLGSLSFLKLLMLCDNGFFGVIGKPEKDIDFSNLRVLDLSSNSFSGELPSQYIFNWNAMKGTYRLWCHPRCFAFIDLSDNKFEGEISDLFGSLKALRSLNLSNNMLTGCIPSSLGYLTELESLDHSRNNLSCHIPQQLKQLGFLSSFNVSHNNLTGPIPQGNQFSVFDNSSFYGNPKLCGDPLSKKCGNSQSSPPLEEDHEDSKSILKKYWIFILAGYISGLVVGVVLADIAITRKPGWFHWFVELLSEWRKPRRQWRT